MQYRPLRIEDGTPLDYIKIVLRLAKEMNIIVHRYIIMALVRMCNILDLVMESFFSPRHLSVGRVHYK